MAQPRPEAPAGAAAFRQVLGHFCTGVTVITTVDGGRPAGFACQAFAALSLTPVLEGALTWVECAVETVHEAGDHYLVVGRVTGLGACRAGKPLLFYRGRYAATDPGDLGHGPAEVVDTLLAWPRHADWM
jgi:flavin reductase (DIM6/NTAB) family NADH-FMN oxidoreductase RutF